LKVKNVYNKTYFKPLFNAKIKFFFFCSYKNISTLISPFQKNDNWISKATQFPENLTNLVTLAYLPLLVACG